MNEEKDFYEFKVIEIIDETTVKEYFSFVFPIFKKAKSQFLYLSENLEYLFEKIDNERNYIY